MKLFCVEFASQTSLDAVFLIKLTSSIHLVILKIAKFLVVSESGSPSAAVVLHNVSLNAKLVNLSSGCTAFEISNMISQVGGQTCFIPWTPDSGHHSWFALYCFRCQKIGHLVVNYGIFLLLSPKTLKLFKSHFVDSVLYAKVSSLSKLFEFSLLIASALFSVALTSLESDLAKLSALVESIDEFVDSLVKVFEQFINRNLVSSSKLGLKINEVLVHMGFFSKMVGKLEKKVVFLKKEYYIKDINISGDSELPPIISDKMFSNLMFFCKYESVDIRTNLFKTAKWLIGLVFCSATLFFVI
ncbi:hypothetical protein G9A89_018433 [Geosiphon pyriformis]|nr:hypothetical protein G9A89_018433 [Geosiphon pyriformis]